MVEKYDKDAEALHELDKLKNLKDELFEASNNIVRLVQALRNPREWRIKSEAPLGYGENNASDIRLPDLVALGEKVHEYQKRHYNLTIKASGLSGSVRKTIESEMREL